MASKQGTAADIKKFVGYTTPDGKTFGTLKEANEHVINAKALVALTDFATKHLTSVTEDGQEPGVDFDDEYRRAYIVSADGFAQFVIAHRDAIIAALKQEVRMRAKSASTTPRKPRAPKAAAAPAPVTAAVAPRPKSATEMLRRPSEPTEGVGFMDDDSDASLAGVDDSGLNDPRIAA